MQDGGVDEEQEQEEDFFAEVSESVMRLGLWSLELFQNHDKVLTDPAQHAQYETIFTQLVQIAINLMNTDKPKIGRNIIEFVSHWLLLLKKVDKPENFAQFYQFALVEVFNVSTTRICCPKWFKFRNNVEDQNEYEDDYVMYREELAIIIFANLASIPLFKDTLLKLLGQALATAQPGVSTFQQAEVVLYLLYNLQ